MDLRAQLQTSLGDAYLLDRELGGGGMSRVFVATERALGRQVVVKVLPAEMAGQVSVERFKREIALAARLQHPHIVPLLTAGETEGLPYFTMPFVEGESLRAVLSRRGELPLPEAVRLLREVANALAYAHERGIVHRDIKPDNVLLSGGSAMVTDFGVAKAVNAAAEGASGVTSVGVALGTPAYMAPEQASADPRVDHRADIYAWGVLAYELLTGQSPFAGRTPSAMIAAHITEEPENVGRRRASVPPALSDLVMRSLSKNPADRPQTAMELVAALDAVGTPSGGAAPARVTTTNARVRRAVYAALALLLVVAVVIVATRWRGGGTSDASAARSLAVLPIVNMGGDSSKQYLADGMTTELAGALRLMPGLQVVGDLSTFRFQHAAQSAADIARQLGVRMLLSGALQSQGGRIRLQMQLADATGKLLWSNTFDRENKDNFALQDEITAAVASDMRLVLSPATLAVSRAGRTVNPEAHDLYMRGMFEKNKLSEQGLRAALRYFADALALDSNYAQARAGMAFTYDMLADAYTPSHEYHLLAREAAERALRSDSMLADARVILGFEMGAANWEFEKGVAEMRRGLVLDPNSPDALFMSAAFLSVAGHTSEAIESYNRLEAIDPLSPMASFGKSIGLVVSGRWAEALRQDSATKRMDPSLTYFDAFDGMALRELGHLPESLAAFRAWEKLTSTPSYGIPATLWKMGRRAEAKQALAALEARARHQWVDPGWMAVAYAGVGDKDNAMRWLNEAFTKKSFSLRWLVNADWKLFAALDGDPRYVALRKRVLTTTFVD